MINKQKSMMHWDSLDHFRETSEQLLCTLFHGNLLKSTLENEGIAKVVNRLTVFLFFFAWILWHYLFTQCLEAAFVRYYNVYLLQFYLILVIRFFDFRIKTSMDNHSFQKRCTQQAHVLVIENPY